MADSEKRYTPAEIVLATGISRYTVRNRAIKLGYETSDGTGYTAEQVMAMVTIPLQFHRKSEEAAMELRETLNKMIEENNVPMCIVQNKKGEWQMEYHK